jgi:tRNA pseudouridine32 synthase / 23S rRNA pseudouridine746 synthase
MHDAPPPRIVFADEAIVVVDKPSGMPSVPARTPLDPPAVAVRLAATLGPLEAVHRLDRDTSGLLVLARSREPRVSLGIAFEERRVAKRYLAVVAGRPPEPAGTVSLPLAADRDRPPRQRVDATLGRAATTRWRLVATHGPSDPAAATSLLAVEPLTGRSHQIRVHLAELGCPIVGDRLYAPPAVAEAGPLALHAAGLAFDHPLTGDKLVFQAPPPAAAPWEAFAAAISAALAAWPSG